MERIDTKADLVAAIEKLSELRDAAEKLKQQDWRLSLAIALATPRLMPNLKKVDGEARFRCGRHVVAIQDRPSGEKVALYSLGTDVELTADSAG